MCNFQKRNKEIEFAKSKGVNFKGKNVACLQCRYLRARGARRF